MKRFIANLAILSGFAGLATGAEPVNFQRDIRPLLSEHCFACHGPAESKAGLRLDTAAFIEREGTGGAGVVIAGEVEASPLIERISSEDEFEVMPPPEHGKPLSDEQKELLRRWVAEGAEYQGHWSLIPPVKVEPPAVAHEELVAEPIDRFILRRLEAEGLEPAGLADRRELIRRLTLDLTGLPPSREAVRAFLDDRSPDAYEQLVDRLLASKQYGEHFGRYWLDLVRYGDTHGLHLDNYREMWPYRDWVISAFNRNLPYDQFITEQLAGDLLPEAGLEQMVASGFNRLNVTTNEGGSIYEEVYVRNVIDRVDAFGTVFLGLTTGCAVCHDHKFDPISAKDFYSLFAFFNSIDGRAMDGNIKDHPPVVRVPTAAHRAGLAELEARRQEIERELDGPLPAVDADQRRWEEQLAGGMPAAWTVLEPAVAEADGESELTILEDGSVQASGTVPDQETFTIEAELPAGPSWQLLRLEVLEPTSGASGEAAPKEGDAASENAVAENAAAGEAAADREQAAEVASDPADRIGRSPNGNVVITEVEVETEAPNMPGLWLPVKLVYAEADYEQPEGKFGINYAIDGRNDQDAGWALGGHLQPGGRSAWFATGGMLSTGEAGRIRVRVRCLSQWAGHHPKRMRLSVTDAPPRPAEDRLLALSDWHMVGPLPIEAVGAGFYRRFTPEERGFQAGDTFQYQDQEFAWQPRPEWSEAISSELPAHPEQASVTFLHRTITAPGPQPVTLLVDTDDGVQISLNGERIGEFQGARPLTPLRHTYQADLKAGENRLLIKVVNHQGPSAFSFAIRSPAAPVPGAVRTAAALAPSERTAQQAEALTRYFRKVACVHPELLAVRSQLDAIDEEQQKLEESIPVTLVWRELQEPRPSYILKRGQYDQQGEPVQRAVPAALPPLPEGAPLNRLGLAQWLTAPTHPLAARVAVNRFWQHLFGKGLVVTSEDFGAQGQPPSHPELLDWLAVDFRENGWDVKRLIKQLVMSHTYRRQSAATPEMQQRDPGNRLLARAPRHRMDAEMLRDAALHLSGLLVEKVGGESVKPPQPEGLWEAVGYTSSNTAQFKPDSGEAVYRRSVYTFWKRTSPPPVMTTFDAPSREACTARRERTNTPLQALVMMNETQFVEASRHFAARILETGGGADSDRLQWAFETATSRLPDQEEEKILARLLADLRELYSAAPDQARQLCQAGGSMPECDAEPVELAAWTMVASTLLNLDEAVNQ